MKRKSSENKNALHHSRNTLQAFDEVMKGENGASNDATCDIFGRNCANCNNVCRKNESINVAANFRVHESNALEISRKLEATGAVILRGLTSLAHATAYVRDTFGVVPVVQPQNTYLTEVRPVDGFLDQSDAKGRAALPPHTDGNSLSEPPSVVSLYCEEQSENPEPTKVVDFLKFVESECLPEEIQWLTTEHHLWTHSHQEGAPSLTLGPVLEIKDGLPRVRFSQNLLLTGKSSPTIAESKNVNMGNNPVAWSICSKLNRFANDPKNALSVAPTAGEAVLISNRHYVHMRNELAEIGGRSFVRGWFSAAKN